LWLRTFQFTPNKLLSPMSVPPPCGGGERGCRRDHARTSIPMNRRLASGRSFARSISQSVTSSPTPRSADRPDGCRVASLVSASHHFPDPDEQRSCARHRRRVRSSPAPKKQGATGEARREARAEDYQYEHAQPAAPAAAATTEDCSKEKISRVWAAVTLGNGCYPSSRYNALCYGPKPLRPADSRLGMRLAAAAENCYRQGCEFKGASRFDIGLSIRLSNPSC